MRIFVNTRFEGHWPVGVAAIAFANSREEAAEQLSAELATAGLPQAVPVEHMAEIYPMGPTAYVLCDGNY